MARWVPILATVALLGACASTPDSPPPEPVPSVTSATVTPALPTTSPTPTPTPSAAPFDPSEAHRTVAELAVLGPREATGEAYARASELVSTRFRTLGYQVTTQEFDVPAGTSWGVRVPAGRTHNVVADPVDFDPEQPHIVIGAHLDTVPQAPGAEDNASGVAVMLELARMVADEPAGLPVRFIAFGAEEPRGSGDARHHYGSQHYVAELSGAQKAATRAMVSLDRVGVRAEAVPLAHGGRGDPAVRRALAEASPAEIPVTQVENTTSDHWSFEKAGIASARIGSVPYAGYHTPRDTPGVVAEDQLGRVGAVMWAWLRTL
ncbi:M20/M25/M40 family metallo-hydrolase [Ammonicoccus fulvus]|uniref:M20/M25/M40 family metallo-hydrolase n=1 Tax=Ammonicoccus fulvus TaxID=3138240 RepID=A0ABZ3FNZ9_9ACTN